MSSTVVLAELDDGSGAQDKPSSDFLLSDGIKVKCLIVYIQLEFIMLSSRYSRSAWIIIFMAQDLQPSQAHCHKLQHR